MKSLLMVMTFTLSTGLPEPSDQYKYMIADLKAMPPFFPSKSFFGPNFEVFNHTRNNHSIESDSSIISHVHVHKNCPRLFQQILIDSNTNVSVSEKAPTDIPDKFLDSYTLNRRIPLSWMYFKQVYNGAPKPLNWTKELVGSFRGWDTCGFYKVKQCGQVIRKYKEIINCKRGIVFGSENPWAEGELLGAGASSIITVEYQPIISEYKNATAYHPTEFAKLVLEDKIEPLDFAFVFSSFEHDGLGRYGDPINPFADLESIARVSCILKPGGYLFLGIPTGLDGVTWNAHRIYGPLRISMILSIGWKFIDLIGMMCKGGDRFANCVVHQEFKNQPIFVLQKRTHEKTDESKYGNDTFKVSYDKCEHFEDYPCLVPNYEGKSVRGDDSRAIYLIQNCTKLLFNSGNSFLSRGYTWDSVIVIPQHVIEQVPPGNTIF